MMVSHLGLLHWLQKSVQKVYDFYRKDDTACVTCAFPGGRPFNMLVNEPEVTGKEEDVDLHSYDLHTKGKVRMKHYLLCFLLSARHDNVSSSVNCG